MNAEKEQSVVTEIQQQQRGTDIKEKAYITEEAFEEAIEYLTDPISGSKAKGRKVLGICG